jgi:hypothetical protein
MLEDIYKRLVFIQSTTLLIDLEFAIRADYAAQSQRLGGRFLTTYALNQGAKPHIIELQCNCGRQIVQKVNDQLLTR